MYSKKKAKKLFAIVISIVVAVIAILVGKYLVFKHVMTDAAIAHLSEKYQISESELELLDYEREHNTISWRDRGTLISEPTKVHCNYRWQFKYNDREFFVTKIDGVYFDDYQLEDIENWSGQWLKQNVDDRIIGLGYSTKNIINYQKSLETQGNKYIFNQENIFDFINDSNTYNDDNFIKLYYYEEDTLYSVDDFKRKAVNESINKKIPKMNFILVYTNTKNDMKLFTDKDLIWDRTYIQN